MIAMDVTVGDDTSIRQRWTLDGVDVTIQYDWISRASGWYVTITGADGEQRVSQRRIEPGADLVPDRTFEGMPPGLIFASGTSALTRREYLGSIVKINYLTEEELNAQA